MRFNKSPQRTSLRLVSLRLVTIACSAIASIWCHPAATAQDDKLSNSYIPGDAISAAFMSPREILMSSEWELAPIEVMQTAGLQYVGIDPTHIEDVKVIIGMPGPMGPVGGAVFRFSQDYNIGNLNPMILNEFEAKNEGGTTIYASRRQPIMQLHQPDARTICVGVGDYLPKMLAASGGEAGQVPDLVSRISRRKGVTMITGMQQLRPLVTGLLRQQASQLPPQLAGLTEFAELTDALLVHVDYAPLKGSISVSAIARDEGSATQLEQTLNNAIDFGQMMATTEMKKNVVGEDPVSQSMVRYIDRVSGQVSGMVRPQRKGQLVRVNLEGNIGTTGILVGLLLPAVQAAREAARRMTASNGLKQIGLGMHNYHSAYRKLPDRAITDENGKPLLSWRVAILPFVEGQALYEEFHLDEPWDSPHNIQLLDRMPEAYVDPSAPVPPGHTVFQVPVGEGLMYDESGTRKFREVLDGLSNTIMAVETSRGSAVPWTKPADFVVNMDQPLAGTGDSHQQGFHVLMGDGAVVFLTKSIDLGLLKALFTRDGKETIEEQLNN